MVADGEGKNVLLDIHHVVRSVLDEEKRRLETERVLALAGEHGVPIQSDPDLVELLSASEIGDEVPEEVYAAVARLLAFLWGLGRGDAA